MSENRCSGSKAVHVARAIAQQLTAIPEVQAVALSGSRTSPFANAESDLDLYAYATEMVPVERRLPLSRTAIRAEMGNAFWEPGDEWIDAEAGLTVDVMYRTTSWIEAQLTRVLDRHEASIGYSTCFWYNVRHSKILFDRLGWLARLQRRTHCSYPEELKRAIVAKNYPLLRRKLSSYYEQIEKAIARHDPVSVNHRVTALLASYFDILFAINEQPHPGEKRVLQFAECLCSRQPSNLKENIGKIVSESPSRAILGPIGSLLDGLEELLWQDHLI